MKTSTSRIHRPDLSLENEVGGVVCGLDEVGRGPLAGPVMAAAVILLPEKIPHKIKNEINDSKKLTSTTRRRIAEALPDFCHSAIGIASVEEIDRINILQASLLAMKRAFMNLAVPPQFALVDGNRTPQLPCPCRPIVKGDQRSLSIAAASILAKHIRDMEMARLAQIYPGYGWENNAGYGTARHLQALEALGVTPHHRRSFAPVQEKLLSKS